MTRTTTILICVLALSAVPVDAQDASDPVSAARFHLGRLGVTPTISVRDIGFDSNVFNEPDNPKRDVTTTVQAQVDSWLRLSRATLNVEGVLDAYYFKKYTNQRSVNGGGAATLAYQGRRVGMFAGGGLRRVRDRPGFEIDLRASRLEQTMTAGGNVRFGGKTGIGVTMNRATTDFDEDETISTISLAESLNRDETIVGIFVSHDVTTLTTVSLHTDVQYDRFEQSSSRDGRRLRFTPSVEFKPSALITGSVTFGLQHFELKDSGQTPFVDPFAAVDLTYILKGRTRFAIRADRDVEYSFQVLQPYYVMTGVTGSITQAVNRSWSVTARGGRQRLDYRSAQRGATLAAGRGGIDTLDQYGAGITWRMRPDVQLGIDANYQQRQTEDPVRRPFEGLRAGAFVRYGG